LNVKAVETPHPLACAEAQTDVLPKFELVSFANKIVPGTKVAITDALPAANDTVQLPTPEQPPDQPENTYPSAGTGVSTAAFSNRAEQFPEGQLISPVPSVTAPLPVTATVSVLLGRMPQTSTVSTPGQVAPLLYGLLE
jgi:hypothetical protein